MKSSLSRLLAATGLAALAPASLAQYCTPLYDATDEWIERVDIVGVGGNTSGSGGPGYEDFSSQVLALVPGQTYTIEVDAWSNIGGEFRLDLWVDYDANDVFDETVIEIAPTQNYAANTLHTLSTSFTVPGTASVGLTRLRVSWRFVVIAGNPDPCSPCGTPCFGQVEDYGVDTSAVGTKYCTANANSTGSPADISAFGSSSSSAGNLTLESAPVPNQPGIFFHGANQTNTPFGNGRLCAGGNLKRGSVVSASGNLAFYTYDNSTNRRDLSAHIGSTRNFQHWYRDPMGGGAQFNTSNGIAIGVLP